MAVFHMRQPARIETHTMTSWRPQVSTELGTTNLLLGIMAAAGVIGALVNIAMGIAGFMAYRRFTTLVAGIDTRQVAPMMERANAILGDVQAVTTSVRGTTDRVDRAVLTTFTRIDDTAARVRSQVRVKTGAVVGFARGVRVALAWMLHGRHRTDRT